jgi:hypothetical protein
MKKLTILISVLAFVLMGAPAVAQQEEGQYASEGSSASYEFVQGTLTDVSPAHDLIRVEGGDGSLTDFVVPLGIPIYYAANDASSSMASRDDLAVGQEVTVGFYQPEVSIMIYPPRRMANQITIFA